ncbi:MAG: nuclear transport factor 2 family protein [Ferruginibacter sp.]
MKKYYFFTILAVAGMVSAFAQKKTNGNIYITHPAITVVEEFGKAFEAGDSAKMASYLTADFKFFDGTSNLNNFGEVGKAQFLSDAASFKNRFDYFKFTNFPGSYPDALEYQKDNKNSEVTVITWNSISGVHKKTGVKIDAAAHYNFTLTSDNKIKRMLEYANSKVFDEIRAGFTTRTNGTIYNHHENINTVRKSMYAFEKGDVDKALSYFADNVKFFDINWPFDSSINKAQAKADWQKFINEYEIIKIEDVGYPDYLQYEIGNGREVLSWWKYFLVRKSDKKKLTVAFHFSDSFNAEGKITSEVSYYGADFFKK